jgi:hypothetical protein
MDKAPTHNAIHQRLLKPLARNPLRGSWNEHNFVFKRGDVYCWQRRRPLLGVAAGGCNRPTLIPLNNGARLGGAWKDAEHALGFSPHGGPELSRSEQTPYK